MHGFVALAVAIPIDPAGRAPVVLARARTLAALAKRVRALAPAAELKLYGGTADLLVAGLPICGVARAPGRFIYLCAPAAAGHGQAGGRAVGA